MARRSGRAEGQVEIVRSDARFRTRNSWLDSRHSFSFGAHYDPANTHFGLLLVTNDDVLAPGAAFPPHPHRDMEIVTWVLDGALTHRDSAGQTGTISPGLAQRMSAGAGIRHTEVNARPDRPVRFVQMWVAPDVEESEPGYAQRDVTDALGTGKLIPLTSGRGHAGALAIRQSGAALHVARLVAGQPVALPEAPFLHLYLARGQISLGAAQLTAGDAARIRAGTGLTVTAAPGPAAEILVWEMHAEHRPQQVDAHLTG